MRSLFLDQSDIDDAMPKIPLWVQEKLLLAANVITPHIEIEDGYLLEEVARIRAVLPNSNHPGFVTRFHSHKLTSQFSFYGGKMEWVAGDIDADVIHLSVLPNEVALQHKGQVRSVPTGMLAIFGEKLWHKSSQHIPQQGQLVAEALSVANRPQLAVR